MQNIILEFNFLYLKKMGLNFEDLRVYKLSLELATGVSKLVDSMPKSAQFGVGDQMIRASQSIMANIAEGYGRFRITAFT